MATSEVTEEFKRILISQSIGSDSSSVHTTPAESNFDTENIGENAFKKRCAERWQAALNHCKAGLGPEDSKIVGQFDSPEKLLAGLEQMQQLSERNIRNGFRTLMYQVHDMEHSVRPLLAIFIVTMLPRSVTTGLIWGIMYLVIRLSAEQEATARKLAGMFLKVRRQMATLQKRAGEIESSVGDSQEMAELRLAFIDIFEALIFFWRECVLYFRKFPPGRFKLQSTSEWVDVETSFAEALLKIEDAMNHLKTYVTINASVALATQSRNVNIPESWQDESRVFPLHLLPDSHTNLFLGREDILSDMESYFEVSSQLDEELSVYVIYGVGGVGKTAVAREFGHRIKRETDAILWVGAESQASLAAGFTHIATMLNLPGADLKANPAQNLALVQHWLRVTTHTWVLILDNVENYADVEKYLPIGARGPVIITTRYIGQAKMFGHRRKALESLDSGTAESLFLRLLASSDSTSTMRATSIDQLSETEREATRFLLSEMDGLALGIHQMAAIIDSQNLQRNVAKFADRYKRHLPVILRKEDGIKGHTLSTLWKMSFELVRTNRSAMIFLGILSCISPDEIPKKLFLPSDTSALTSDLNFCKDDFELDETVAFLLSLGLINANDSRLSLHRLVQVAFMMQLSSEERQIVVDSASELLRLAFPKKRNAHLYLRWAECQQFSQHITALAGWLDRLSKANMVVSPSPAFISCVGDCGWYLIETGNAKGAREILEIAVDLDGSKFDVERSHILNALGMVYYDLNMLTKCRETLLKSQEMREALLPPTSVYCASSFQNVGNVDSAEGHYDNAIINFDKTIDILKCHDSDFETTAAGSAKEMSLEEKEHIHTTGIAHLNKAMAYIRAKNYPEGLSSLKTYQALAERSGSRFTILYLVQYCYGNLYLGMGDYEEAISRYEQALDQVRQRVPGHAIEASIYYKMGTAQFRARQLQAAMASCSSGLQKAKLRDECQGQQARLLRRQAHVIETARQEDDGAVWLEPVKSINPEDLLEQADRIRLQLQGSAYRILENEEEEDRCYDSLVGPFTR
ncbi:hypothetical protein F5Y16DRAFT_396032 [Xylariaceae sp. FL0255]|nr:hypothetical protein F5Y16DRAFT_396032 [Xylariaceae sp. FL0255]